MYSLPYIRPFKLVSDAGLIWSQTSRRDIKLVSDWYQLWDQIGVRSVIKLVIDFGSNWCQIWDQIGLRRWFKLVLDMRSKIGFRRETKLMGGGINLLNDIQICGKLSYIFLNPHESETIAHDCIKFHPEVSWNKLILDPLWHQFEPTTDTNLIPHLTPIGSHVWPQFLITRLTPMFDPTDTNVRPLYIHVGIIRFKCNIEMSTNRLLFTWGMKWPESSNSQKYMSVSYTIIYFNNQILHNVMLKKLKNKAKFNTQLHLEDQIGVRCGINWCHKLVPSSDFRPIWVLYGSIDVEFSYGFGSIKCPGSI